MSYIDKYIDRNILDEYAEKPFLNGYTLDVIDIPKNELSNLIELLLQRDPALREIVLDYVQEKIDERLPEFESDRRYHQRLEASA